MAESLVTTANMTVATACMDVKAAITLLVLVRMANVDLDINLRYVSVRKMNIIANYAVYSCFHDNLKLSRVNK